jgi:hypothetical protein
MAAMVARLPRSGSPAAAVEGLGGSQGTRSQEYHVSA